MLPVTPGSITSLMVVDADEKTLRGFVSKVYLSMLSGVILMIDIRPHAFLELARNPSEL
jgi:hypothetical protein